jgi:hypothetical protein
MMEDYAGDDRLGPLYHGISSSLRRSYCGLLDAFAKAEAKLYLLVGFVGDKEESRATFFVNPEDLLRPATSPGMLRDLQAVKLDI